jgi:hypothetical protein
MNFEIQRHDGTKEVLNEDALQALVREGNLVFETMGLSGDVKKIWDPTKVIECDDARRSFDDLRAKGYLAFRTDEKGVNGDQMTEFDPKAGRVVLVPPMAGG